MGIPVQGISPVGNLQPSHPPVVAPGMYIPMGFCGAEFPVLTYPMAPSVLWGLLPPPEQPELRTPGRCLPVSFLPSGHWGVCAGHVFPGDGMSAWGILPVLSPSLPAAAQPLLHRASPASGRGLGQRAAGLCSRVASTGPRGRRLRGGKTFQACRDPGKSFAQGFLPQVRSSWRS